MNQSCNPTTRTHYLHSIFTFSSKDLDNPKTTVYVCSRDHSHGDEWWKSEWSAIWCCRQTVLSPVLIYFCRGSSVWRPSNPLSVELSCGVLDWNGDVLTSCEIKGNWSMASLIGSRRVPAASNPLGSDGCPQPKPILFSTQGPNKIADLKLRGHACRICFHQSAFFYWKHWDRMKTRGALTNQFYFSPS